jgi:N-methylhydantoinase B
MNNLAMGARGAQGVWDYYETLGGGMGAHAQNNGLSAVQTHMTNTLNTPVEVLETAYPLRIHRYQVRSGSGGDGVRKGGDGLSREYEFLAPAQVTLLTERRSHRPWGLMGGQAGLSGENSLNGWILPAKVSLQLAAGDRLLVETPGGGGYLAPE